MPWPEEIPVVPAVLRSKLSFGRHAMQLGNVIGLEPHSPDVFTTEIITQSTFKCTTAWCSPCGWKYEENAFVQATRSCKPGVIVQGKVFTALTLLVIISLHRMKRNNNGMTSARANSILQYAVAISLDNVEGFSLRQRNASIFPLNLED